MTPPRIPVNRSSEGKAPASPDEGWVLTALLVIGSTATVLATLLGDRVGVSALQAWSSELLTAVSVLALVAMTAGLALFHLGEGASVSATLERLLIAIGIMVLVWIAFGYSVTQTGGNDIIGGFSKAFLRLVTADSRTPTYTVGFTISEFSYVIFQGCAAAMTSALIIGVLGKRIKLAEIALFVPLWAALIYFPILHMVWYWAGPDAIADAAKAVAAAGDAAAKIAAQARFDEIIVDAGWLFKKGLLDYAGGTVIAISAGVTGLAGLALLNDSKTGASPDSRQPISGPGALGLGLIWLAWFGVNAASNLDFGDAATKVAMANCFSATAAAAIAGAAAEWLIRGQSSLRAALYGALAGIIAIAPASAFAGTVGTLILGGCAGTSAIAVLSASRASGLGALPDIPLILLAGGLIGTLATGMLADPSLGGMGVMDYTTGKVGEYDFATQMIAQLWGAGITLLWAGVGSFILFKFIDLAVGLRPAP
jgi:Amt family ammonium transporter